MAAVFRIERELAEGLDRSETWKTLRPTRNYRFFIDDEEVSEDAFERESGGRYVRPKAVRENGM